MRLLIHAGLMLTHVSRMGPQETGTAFMVNKMLWKGNHLLHWITYRFSEMAPQSILLGVVILSYHWIYHYLFYKSDIYF